MLAASEDDTSLDAEIGQEIKTLAERIERMETELLLSEEKDINNAIVSIHPGAGGTESQDWAQMLLRMYVRWGEKRGYKVEEIDLQQGDEAGIKSATFSRRRYLPLCSDKNSSALSTEFGNSSISTSGFCVSPYP